MSIVQGTGGGKSHTAGSPATTNRRTVSWGAENSSSPRRVATNANPQRRTTAPARATSRGLSGGGTQAVPATTRKVPGDGWTSTQRAGM